MAVRQGRMNNFMKKFVVPALMAVLLCLFGCGQTYDWQSESFSPPGTTPEGETVALLSYTIPLSDIDPFFGPGPFTLAELAERFGEPVELTFSGTMISVATVTACYQRETGKGWNNIWFELVLDRPYTQYDDDPQKVDRSLPMEVLWTHIHDGDFPLPRGIRLGDSYKEVRKAYPETPYWGGHRYTGDASLFYIFEGAAPDDCGIWYEFYDGETLGSVSIKWLALY